MANDKPRNMSPKGFIHKATIAKSAIAFLTAHREYLTNGELAPITSPIVAKIDNGEVMPTPGLSEIIKAVFDHNLAQETNKAKAAMVKANEPKEVKAVLARILNGKGEVVTVTGEDGKETLLEQDFDSLSDADRWCDRRLFDSASDCYGEVIHTKIVIKGKHMTTRVNREEAIARILRKPKGAVLAPQKKGTNSLGFGVKCSQDVAKFSRG